MQPRQLIIRASKIGVTLALTSAAAWACGGDSGPESKGNYGGVSGAGSPGGSNAGGSGPVGGASGVNAGGVGGVIAVGGSGPGGAGGNPEDDACGSFFVEAKKTPLDIYILLDQSGSMVIFGEDRWTPVVTAIKAFVASPDMEGVGVGLGYFGMHPPGQPPVDPTAPGSCNANDYARPDVPIDMLPPVRQPIETSLNAHNTPGGGTPTHPALQGAMQYATSWAVAHPDRKVVIVLATDGEPQGCNGNDVASVTQVAGAGAAANPQINTYVIGVGPNLQNMNQVAQAGSSTDAFLVAAGNADQFLNAMKQIRGIALGCEFDIPATDGKPPDFSKVNMWHTPTGGGQSVIYKVEGVADCRPDTGGWYYEEDAGGNPIGIRACPASCDALVTGGGRVDIQVGCASRRPPA
jgi:hypothetical protein